MPTKVPAFTNWIEAHRDRYALRDIRTYPAATSGPKNESTQAHVVFGFVSMSQSLAISPSRRELNVISDRAARRRLATVR